MTTRAPLLPCTHCGRHVRASETSCPFCRADRTVTMRAMSTLVLGASMAVAGCHREAPVETSGPTTMQPAPTNPPAQPMLTDPLPATPPTATPPVASPSPAPIATPTPITPRPSPPRYGLPRPPPPPPRPNPRPTPTRYGLAAPPPVFKLTAEPDTDAPASRRSR